MILYKDITQKNINLFWSHIIFPNNIKDGCWLTNYQKNSHHKYKNITINNNVISIHRFMYMIWNKCDIPKKMIIRHKCHNPECCNPYHLIIGTPQDNSNDMKNANRSLYGENNPNKILTEKDVLNFLKDCENSLFNSTKDAAIKYNVNDTTIQHILNGISWKNITDSYHIPLNQLKNKIVRSKYHANNLMNEKLVKEMLNMCLLNNFNTIKEISIYYNISHQTVTNILNGKSWKHVTYNYDLNSIYNKFKKTI
jgi:hypothetical protein